MYGILIARHMRFNAFASILTLTFLILFFAIAPAHADPVALTPAYSYANEFLLVLFSGLALAFVAWAVWAFHTYATPILKKYLPAYMVDKLEQKAAAALNTALANGVSIAMNKVEEVERENPSVDLKHEWANTAASYALKFAPDAVAKFGLSPDDLALKALAFVPVAPATTVGVTGAVDPVMPVSSRPLPAL